jgi:hypothetical protein
MNPITERRRSARVSDSRPLIIRGYDLLGQPFEERTTTLNLNLHGCRYASKHHLPKNTWLTIELPKNLGRRNMRARVAWIQRPHSVREFFQIAVELESPENIWGVDSPPVDWTADAPLYHSSAGSGAQEEQNETVNQPGHQTGRHMTDMNDSAFAASEVGAGAGPEFAPAADSPFLRQLHAELERHAAKAIETATERAEEKIRRSQVELDEKRTVTSEDLARQFHGELERAQAEARDEFLRQLAERRAEALVEIQGQSEENLRRAKELLAEFDQKIHSLRSEGESAQETIGRLAQTRLQIEGAEAARESKVSAESAGAKARAADSELGAWRERLQAEMNHAQEQWNELLQSSLDVSLQRLVEQLSQRSLEAQQATEQKMSEGFAELIHPVNEAAARAGQTLSEIRMGLEMQVAAARGSLEDVERTAARIRENSAQFEAAGHDSLNELHRRLENVLDAQTAEMSRRIETLASGMSQRISPMIEAMGSQQVERAVAQMEAKLAPHLERVPALLRELEAREGQTEEGLRLHRERLRQLSENNQRDVASRMVFTLAELHRDFESARTQALAKWNEELDASGVRASHAATENLTKTSEWFQQEARSRLQVLVEQALASANAGLDGKVENAAHKFEIRLAEQSSDRLAQASQNLEGLSNDVAARTKTRLESAAEEAAASFGQVVRGISDQEVDFLGQRSRAAIHEQSEQFEQGLGQLMRNLESDAQSSVERFHSQIAAQFQDRIVEGKNVLAAEFATTLDGYRAERDAHHASWIAKLHDLSGAAENKYQERLESATDSWSVSSVRRLNEHGQNVIESLMRSADQALRDSFAKIFEGMSEILRDRAPLNASGMAGFVPPAVRESSEQSRNESSQSSNA